MGIPRTGCDGCIRHFFLTTAANSHYSPKGTRNTQNTRKNAENLVLSAFFRVFRVLRVQRGLAFKLFLQISSKLVSNVFCLSAHYSLTKGCQTADQGDIR
jgi:hypothetical protein